MTMPCRTLRVGLIGFGAIGKVHACCYANLPFYYKMEGYRVKITHVCTAHAETASAAAALLDAEAVTDYKAITENPEIDIVDIATPNGNHAEVLKSAIRHNKHIYCEKPLVSTAAEAAEIAALLKNYTGISQMVLQYRFSPAVMRAKQLIDEGRLGTILEFRGHFLHAGSSRPETVIKPWKLEGGVIADLGSHTLDVLHFLLGDFDSL
ncbi:MAG: Gfo/Idh/MocA family oxidoreductase, partial [Lentisphaeria bacterium]|nr:Gfo/Idh/MocA family oxidoreductase [Lentisphaeria bacterium]